MFAKNLLSIVHLLLAIVTFYQTRKNMYLDLPKSLNIDVLIVRSLNGSTTYKKETETLFRYAMISMRFIFLVVILLSLSWCIPFTFQFLLFLSSASQPGDFDVPLDQDKEEKRKLEQKLLSFTNSHLGTSFHTLEFISLKIRIIYFDIFRHIIQCL